MTPLFFTLESGQPLRIMPDTRVKMDGHPILSYNYKIFLDGKRVEQSKLAEQQQQPPETIKDQDYLGFISFEKPGHMFTYSAGPGQTLQPGEAEEIIAYLSHIRDNPTLWRAMGQV